MDWNEIITCISSSDKTYDADKQLATLIVQNDAKAVHYYLKDIGTPIMEYIEHVITKENITGEYYIFLSSPFDTEEERPLWHRVELYKGLNSSLSSYTSKITIRHFCYIVNKEKKIQTKSGGILEYVDYESLLKLKNAAPDSEEEPQIKCVRAAFEMLSERYQNVLRCLIIEKMSAIEAFPILSPFIHPRPKDGMSSEQVKSEWTKKQRQDALSLIKGYALTRLQKNFRQLKNKYYI